MNGSADSRRFRQNSFTREAAMEALIKKYIGRAYDKDTYNCWHFIKEFYSDFGYELFDIHLKTLDKDWAYRGVNYFLDNLAHDWTRINEPKEYDAVLFKNYKNVAFHAGVIIDAHKFIHCAQGAGVIISRLDEKAWQRRIEGFYTLQALSRLKR